MDFEFERNGALGVAIEPHQVEWLHEESTRRRGRRRRRALPRRGRGAGGGRLAHLPRAASGTRAAARSCTRRSSPPSSPASPRSSASRSSSARRCGASTTPGSTRRGRRSSPTAAACVAQHAVLATNVFPTLLKRNRLMTVPVYDYVLMTEPLSAEQLGVDRLANRQGIGDLANQFHYYRLSRDNRILFGGYDAIYHYGRRVRARVRATGPSRSSARRATSSRRSPSSRGCGSATGGRARSTRARGSARSSAPPATSASRTPPASRASASAPTRFAAEVMLDLLERRDNERTSLAMVRERPLPFPPEPAAVDRHQRHPLVARPGRPHRGRAQPAAEDPRRARTRVRLMSRRACTASIAAHGDGCRVRSRSTHEPVPADQVVAGAPTTGHLVLDDRRRAHGRRVGDDARRDARRRGRRGVRRARGRGDRRVRAPARRRRSCSPRARSCGSRRACAPSGPCGRPCARCTSRRERRDPAAPTVVAVAHAIDAPTEFSKPLARDEIRPGSRAITASTATPTPAPPCGDARASRGTLDGAEPASGAPAPARALRRARGRGSRGRARRARRERDDDGRRPARAAAGHAHPPRRRRRGGAHGAAQPVRADRRGSSRAS